MPLSPEVDEKILDRFDELIEEGTKLADKMREQHADWKLKNPRIHIVGGEMSGHTSEFHQLVTKSRNLIKVMLGHSEETRNYQKRIDKLTKDSSSVQQIVGILQGLKDNYENGFCDELGKQIVAYISSDYMSQAEQLLDESANGQYTHVPAAVLCGAVLEDAIRRLCDRQSPPIPTKKENGNFKKLAAMIDDLKKENVIKPLKRDQLQSWVKIRNSAAHGKFDEFKRDDVDLMLSGVKNFLADFL